MLKPRVNYKNMPKLTLEEFRASMREYAATLYAAVKDIPEPEVTRKPKEELHGPGCVCEDCFPKRIARLTTKVGGSC